MKIMNTTGVNREQAEIVTENKIKLILLDEIYECERYFTNKRRSMWILQYIWNQNN